MPYSPNREPRTRITGKSRGNRRKTRRGAAAAMRAKTLCARAAKRENGGKAAHASIEQTRPNVTIGPARRFLHGGNGKSGRFFDSAEEAAPGGLLIFEGAPRMQRCADDLESAGAQPL